MKILSRYRFARITACAVLTIIWGITRGQSNFYIEKQRTFYGGLLAGFNLSTVDNIDYPRYDKLGWNLGGVVYAKFSQHIAGSMELLYSQKGMNANSATLSNVPGATIISLKTHLNYAEIPLMINYFDQKVGMAGAGISYGRLVYSSETLNTSPPGNGNLSVYPYHNNDVEAVIGGGFSIWQGLYLCARFQYSLSQIRNKVPAALSPSGEFNNLWVCRLMYLF